MRSSIPLAALAALTVIVVIVGRGSVAEARPAATGFYSEAGLGATSFIGRGYASSAIGPAIDLRLGTDLWPWLSLGIHLEASSHEATVRPPPVGEYFQLYRGYGDARLGFRVGALAFFAEGGAGAAYISSNILQRAYLLDPGERFTLAFTGGGGVEYQLQNRHYAVGLAGDWWMLPQFDRVQGVDARLYLRYTY